MSKVKLVTDASGSKVGHVVSFRGPAFVGRQTMYTAIGLDGKPVGMAQMSFEAAAAILRRMV